MYAVESGLEDRKLIVPTMSHCEEVYGDGAQPKIDCGTHIITGGTGKYAGITGSEPFACIPMPTLAGPGGYADVIEAIVVRNFAEAAYPRDGSDAIPAKGRAAAE
jgi:hypothetical protein